MVHNSATFVSDQIKQFELANKPMITYHLMAFNIQEKIIYGFTPFLRKKFYLISKKAVKAF